MAVPTSVGTGSSTAAAAAAYAQQRAGYSPASVQQEGTVTYQNGVPGVYIKYNTPQGTSTEFTPIGSGSDYGSFNPAASDFGSGGGGGGGGLSGDPNVANALALAAKMRASAQASALAKREQMALQYGSAEGLQNLIGGDYAKIAQQAQNNPYSVLSNLSRGYTTGVNTLEDQLNKANLFYSGYRGQQLGNAATQYGQQKYTAGTQYQGGLTDVADQLAQSLMNADMLEQNAYMGSQYNPGGGSSPPAANPNVVAPNSSGFYPGLVPGGSDPNYAANRGVSRPKAPPRVAPPRYSYAAAAANRLRIRR